MRVTLPVQRRFSWPPAGEVKMGTTAWCLFQLLLSLPGPWAWVRVSGREGLQAQGEELLSKRETQMYHIYCFVPGCHSHTSWGKAGNSPAPTESSLLLCVQDDWMRMNLSSLSLTLGVVQTAWHCSQVVLGGRHQTQRGTLRKKKPRARPWDSLWQK